MSRFGEVGGVSPYGGKAGGGDVVGSLSTSSGGVRGEGRRLGGSVGSIGVVEAYDTWSAPPCCISIVTGSSSATFCDLLSPGSKLASTLAFPGPASRLLPGKGSTACLELTPWLSRPRCRSENTAAGRWSLLTTSSSADGARPRCSAVISLMTAALYLSSEASSASAVPTFENCRGSVDCAVACWTAGPAGDRRRPGASAVSANAFKGASSRTLCARRPIKQSIKELPRVEGS